MIQIINAGVEDIDTIQHLAKSIWPLAYKDILHIEQLNYMLNEFYNAKAIENQILTKGHQFFIAQNNHKKALGFASVSFEKLKEFKLQKLYVLTEYHGQQLGTKLLNRVIDYCKEREGNKLILNVNRYNKARYYYEKQGFKIIDEVDIPIGKNYFMNDFVMERNL
jgi:ribosomal protein S18 acetylase RimI-like enzyme